VTGDDDTKVLHFTPQTKQAAQQWKRPTSPTANKFEVRQSAGKVKAPVSRDSKGVIHVQFMPRGATVKANANCNELR
jgi:hypothetical protein